MSGVKRKKITFAGCAFQLFTDVTLCTVECMLLAVMSYDRFNAVCKPLHYMTIMNPQLCQGLMAMTWVIGIINCMILSPHAMSLPRCGNHHLITIFVKYLQWSRLHVWTPQPWKKLYLHCVFSFSSHHFFSFWSPMASLL